MKRFWQLWLNPSQMALSAWCGRNGFMWSWRVTRYTIIVCCTHPVIFRIVVPVISPVLIQFLSFFIWLHSIVKRPKILFTCVIVQYTRLLIYLTNLFKEWSHPSHCKRTSTGYGRRNTTVLYCNDCGMLHNPVARLFNNFTAVVSRMKRRLSMQTMDRFFF